MKKYIFYIFILFPIIAKSQQIPVIDHYFTNPYLLNPAKVGTADNTNIFLLNRQQWTDIQGAPRNTLMSIDGSINQDKIGLGIMFSNDADNIFSRTAFYGSYSYHFKLNTNQTLSLALSLGLMNVHISFDELQADNTSDPLVFSQNGAKTKLDATAGINYKFKKLEVGLVGYQLMNTKYQYQDQTNNTDLNYQLIQHFLILANYKFTVIPEKLVVAPNIIARTTLGLPIQFDIGVYLNHRDLIWSYIGYRHNSCVYLNLGGKIYNNITISGAYEYNIGEIAKFSGPSYEILLGYRFSKKNTTQTNNSYSDRKAIENMSQNSQLQSETIDKIVYENKVLKNKINDSEKEITVLKEEVERLKKTMVLSETDKKEIEEFKQLYEVKVSDLKVNESKINNSDSLEIYQTNKFNVIVGAYKTIKNAKLGQIVLQREFDLKTYIIKNDESTFFFIATNEFDQIKDVKKEFKRLKKIGVEKLIMGDIWVYKAK
ncbi:MAG: hypothetical protein A2W99_14320 [Bacteroidetes bacterium GWF2_33_16]|nr:MAG: hypothetical protein A2X00_06250 [Bacteroidetes bacterium GWE2_32_14]OFY04800.1 MAG: hypothetical protein A2W99_14320 [Bacteroidetes bacterium GWF2_33_16]